MPVIRVKETTSKIPLGRQGENEARRIQFNLSAWQMEYGPGTAKLIHKRPGDKIAYPVQLQVEGAAAYWDVSEIDTENPGTGMCELTYYVDEVVAKSITYRTVIDESMSGEIGNPPAGLPNWVDTVNQTVIEANEATQEALEAAKTANEAAEKIESIPDYPNVANEEEVKEMLDEVFEDGPSSEMS